MLKRFTILQLFFVLFRSFVCLRFLQTWIFAYFALKQKYFASAFKVRDFEGNTIILL